MRTTSMRTALSGLMVTWACLGVAGDGEAQVINRTAPVVAPTPVETQPLSGVRLGGPRAMTDPAARG